MLKDGLPDGLELKFEIVSDSKGRLFQWRCKNHTQLMVYGKLLLKLKIIQVQSLGGSRM